MKKKKKGLAVLLLLIFLLCYQSVFAGTIDSSLVLGTGSNQSTEDSKEVDPPNDSANTPENERAKADASRIVNPKLTPNKNEKDANKEVNEDFPPIELEQKFGRYKPRYVTEAMPYAWTENIKFKWARVSDYYRCTHEFYGDPSATLYNQHPSMLKASAYGKIWCTQGGYGIYLDGGIAPEESITDWNDDSRGWNTASFTVYSATKTDSIENKIYRIAADYYGQSNLESNKEATAFTQMAIWNKLPVKTDYSEGSVNGRYLSYFSAGAATPYKNFLTTVIEPQLKVWDTKPSFSTSTIKLDVGESKVLTDSTGSIKYYDSFTYVKNGVAISHTKGNNTMVATALETAKETVSMSESELIAEGACKYPDKYSGGYYEFIHPDRQNLVHCNGRVNPQSMSLNFKVDVSGFVKARKVPSSESHLVALCPQQYSLEGATYAIYTSEANAEADTNRVVTLKTDENGYLPTTELNAYTNNGVYYMKEISPPKGYILNQRVYQFKVNVNQTTNVTVDDKPYFDPMTITLQKQIPNGLPEFQKYLEGAEYTVRYYPDILNTESEVKAKKPLRTWVFRTDANGEVRIRESWKVGGDELFKNDKGTVVGLIGTYTVEETKAPSGFVKNSGIEIRHIKKGVDPPDINGTNAPVMSELPDNNINRKITVTKKIAEKDYYEPFGTPTAIFELTGKDVFGKTYKFRKSITLSKSTLKDGYYTGSVVFSNLPAGEYTVREIGALRYKFKSISNTSSNGVVSGQKVNFELVNTLTGSTTYQNEIKRWDKTSHNTCVVNKM